MSDIPPDPLPTPGTLRAVLGTVLLSVLAVAVGCAGLPLLLMNRPGMGTACLACGALLTALRWRLFPAMGKVQLWASLLVFVAAIAEFVARLLSITC